MDMEVEGVAVLVAREAGRHGCAWRVHRHARLATITVGKHGAGEDSRVAAIMLQE